MSLGEQRGEIHRLVGLARLGLDDDRVGEIFRKARAPYER
jgi:hypothetical protein